MIETPLGLENVEAICAVSGLDGVYVGPSDLRLAVGGARPAMSPSTSLRSGPHPNPSSRRRCRHRRGHPHAAGDVAARRLAQGYTFATVASDLAHLKTASAQHLKMALGS